MTYGSYSFSPVPLMNISKQWRDITSDGASGTYLYNINLDGNVNYPFAHAEKSYNGIDYNYNNYKYNIK